MCVPLVPLNYQTDALEEDFTIGARSGDSHTRGDRAGYSDWVMKLIDVYSGDYSNPDPNGVEMGNYQQLVRGEPMRGKFRDSLENPRPFEPGKVTRVEYVLPKAYHAL